MAGSRVANGRAVPRIAAAVLLATACPAEEPSDVCSPVSEEHARSSQGAFERAQPLLLEGHWAEAEPLLREALRLSPGHALALYGLGQASLEQGRAIDAVAAFRRSRASFRCVLTADTDARAAMKRNLEVQLAQFRTSLWNLERRSMAERQVLHQQVNRHHPPPPRGEAQQRVRDLRAQIDEMERALEADDPAPPSITLALGTALIQAGDFTAAEDELRAAVDALPESGDARNNLAVALMLTGQFDEAEHQAHEAERLGVPVSPRLYEEIRRRRE